MKDHIHPGKLTMKAALQSASSASDGMGGESFTWSKDRDLWCLIEEPTARMAQVAMAREEQTNVVITARYNSDITTEKRIVYGSDTYRIEAVLRRGTRNEFVHIIAKKGVAT